MRGEDIRHQQQFAPILRIVSHDYERALIDDAYGVPLFGNPSYFEVRNFGNGPAFEIYLEVSGTRSYRRRVGERLLPDSFKELEPDEEMEFVTPQMRVAVKYENIRNTFSDSGRVALIGAKETERIQGEHGPPGANVGEAFVSGKLTYKDMFGNVYATDGFPGAQQVVWNRPKNIGL